MTDNQYKLMSKGKDDADFVTEVAVLDIPVGGAAADISPVVVTFTPSDPDDLDNSTWTADKTFAEVESALTDGRNVFADVPAAGATGVIPVSMHFAGSSVLFTVTENNDQYNWVLGVDNSALYAKNSVVNQQELIVKSSDGTELGTYDGGTATTIVLPEATAADISPCVATFTPDDPDNIETTTWTVDKTFAEFDEAYTAGRNVIARLSVGGNIVDLVMTVAVPRMAYKFTWYEDGVFTHYIFGADDSFTIRNEGIELSRSLHIKDTDGNTIVYWFGRENAELTLPDGAELYVVNVTTEDGANFTADKTFAEIKAAHLRGANVMVGFDGGQISLTALEDTIASFDVAMLDNTTGAIGRVLRIEIHSDDTVVCNLAKPAAELTIKTPGSTIVYDGSNEQTVDLTGLTGGSGVSVFYVAIEGNPTTGYTSDKTLNEIEAAHNAGQIVKARLTDDAAEVYLDLYMIEAGQCAAFALNDVVGGNKALITITADGVEYDTDVGKLRQIEFTGAVTETYDPASHQPALTINIPEQVQADWNENDPNNAAYIKNRLAYKETVAGEFVYLPDTEMMGADDDGDGTNDMFVLLAPWAFDFVKEQQYVITYNGTEYACDIAYMSNDGVDQFAFGNLNVMGDTWTEANPNAPFILVCINNADTANTGGMYGMLLPLDGATTATISVKMIGEQTHVKTIDPEYLPQLPYLTEDPNSNLINGSISGSLRTISSATEDDSYYVGDNAFAHGSNTKASGGSSHAQGISTISSGYASHAEGSTTKSSGTYSHAEGSNTIAAGTQAHSEGQGSNAIGNASHAEGNNTISYGSGSHTEGDNTISYGSGSHAEGDQTVSNAQHSHAEGRVHTINTYITGEANATEYTYSSSTIPRVGAYIWLASNKNKRVKIRNAKTDENNMVTITVSETLSETV